MGTGTGFLALLIAAAGHRVTAVDLADGMLEVARRRARESGLRVRFERGDAVAPPFSEGSFDVITSRHLLWTLREPAAALASWWRLLRPGGYVVAIDGRWFPEPGTSAAEEHGAEPNLFDAHYTPATRAALPLMAFADRSALSTLARAAGFVDVSLRDLPRELWTQTPAEGAPYVLVARR